MPCLSYTFFLLCVDKDMAVPESGETQQSLCEAVGGRTEADMYVPDQEDLRLLLQVQDRIKQQFSRKMLQDL